MKPLLRFISNDGTWIIEESPNGSLKLYRNCVYPETETNGITFVESDLGTLSGLLMKFEQKLAERPK